MPETNLELEIAKIEKDLAVKRAALEQEKQNGNPAELPTEKETLHEIVGRRIESAPPLASQPLPVQTVPSVPAPMLPGTPSYMSDELNPRVRTLIDVAFTKSIDKAIIEAKKTRNAALIDAFHDALVDELYQNLIDYRKLKKI